LDIGIFSRLQKAYGKEVDRLTRFGNVAITKGNFLPLLVKARAQAYTKDNILGAWRGSGLIPSNPRKVLTKLPTYRDPEKKSKPASPPPVPPTPRNSAAMLRKARQAKLLLQQKNQDIDRVELAGLIDSLERFALNTDKDLQLERDTLRKWQQTQKLAAPINRKELSTEEGTVLNGTVLHQLYLQRDRAEKKKEAAREARAQRMSQPLSRKNKGKATQPHKVSVHFEESDGSSAAEASLDGSGFEMEDWESDLETPLDQDSSVESVIMVATPLPLRRQAPPLSQTPVRPRHVSPIVVGRSVGSPVHRVTRSRAARN